MDGNYRLNITQTLAKLSGSGKPITDQEILKWANATAQKGNASARSIRSFKDPSLSTGVFFLDVLEGLRPGIVDRSMVMNIDVHGSYDDKRANGQFPCLPFLNYTNVLMKFSAKLAISIARKMNALIFLVPEDIVDVRQRLVDFRSPPSLDQSY